MKLRHWVSLKLNNFNTLYRLGRLPITRYFARRDAERLFDLVAGFTYSQVLYASVEIGLLHHLQKRPMTAADLVLACQSNPETIAMLCRAAQALGLIDKSAEHYTLGRLGAATLAVPGLVEIISHHKHLYADLADPLALLDGAREATQMSEFWPYVLSGASRGSEDYRKYSALMSATQFAVARDTVAQLALGDATRFLDIGGGEGVFARAVKARFSHLDVAYMDLPQVVAGAASSDVTPIAGNFQEDELPKGYDVISLVRILFDHQDATVLALLDKVFHALPIGGQLAISEPMRGDENPTKIGDCYYALYCHAMKTGKARSPSEIKFLLERSGFSQISIQKANSPENCQVITAFRKK